MSFLVALKLGSHGKNKINAYFSPYQFLGWVGAQASFIADQTVSSCIQVNYQTTSGVMSKDLTPTGWRCGNLNIKQYIACKWHDILSFV